MANLISRQAALEALTIEYNAVGILGEQWAVSQCIDAVNKLPAIDPVKHGKWIKNKGRCGWHCSVCGEDDFYAFVRDNETGENKLQDHYCPNCGAKMNE